MCLTIRLLLRGALLAFLSSCVTAGTQSPTKPIAPNPTPAQPTAGPTAAPPVPPSPTEPTAAEAPRSSENLHCFQCTGESTDPDDHCTDSGWVSIPRGRRLDYRFLCPEQMSDFCMKSIERWESTHPGVADKFRTRRGCSGKTRTSQQGGDKPGAGAKFAVSNGCTDFRKNPATGAFVQLCFCGQSLCNTGGRWTTPSAQLLILLPLAATRL